MRLLLDSAFVIDHMRGLPQAVDRFRILFEAGDEPFINEIVVCEVRAGTRSADLPGLHAFLEPVEFIAPGAGVALLAGASARPRAQPGLPPQPREFTGCCCG